MLRNLAAAVALILLSQTALGLGLGTLRQSSGLNEPFAGRIEILGTMARGFDTVVVKLADSEQFERAGVRRDAVLLQLRFKIVEPVSGADYIQISSREPIREPFLNFLLELNWANGRMVREYTVLLDPPLYDPVRRRVEATPAATSPTPPAAPAPIPEQPAETMADTAPLVSEPAVEQQPPAAFAAGVTLGPIVVNDTLWSIASANLPDGSVSVQQMMLAILRTNPDAFGNDNINILLRGAILRLPERSEIDAMSRLDAIEEVRRQHQLWRDYRDVATATVAERPLGPATGDAREPMADEPLADDAMAGADTDAVGDARLELVTPRADDEQLGAGAADGEADITLAREEIDAQVQENTELQARITEANEIIELMQRQVDIQDDELAALQARLAELGIEVPADVATGVVDAEDMVEGPSDAEAMAEESTDALAELDVQEATPLDPSAIEDIDLTIGDEVEAVAAAEVPAIEGEDETAVAMDEGAGVVPDGDGSMLGGLIPGHIANMVPGGAMTVLGILGAVLLAGIVGLVKLLGGRRAGEEDELGAAGDEDVTSLTAGFGEDDEPITETREGESEGLEAEDATEVAPGSLATTPDFQVTLEASAEELLPDEPQEAEEDPLEEVNVYLAYERFDQAEELVRKVIVEHADEHEYKLRLLEVFYSSNNIAAYEEAARALHEAVGEDDALWESTVAMWTEMSPERALFAAGAAEPGAAPAGDEGAKVIVDITAADEAGGATMTMAPGSDAVLESTQIGLHGGPDEADDPGSLDFDLGAGDGDDAGEEILDLTATTEGLGDGEDMLDLTAGMDDTDGGRDGLLDITAGMEESPAAQSDGLDIGVTDELADGDDLLDLTTPESGDSHDLLDVTTTGGLAGDRADDILNVTSPGLLDEAAPAADEETADAGESSGIDFDISDTVSPAFETGVEEAGEVIDLTTPSSDATGGTLDFDIAELEDTTLDAAADDETLDISGGLEFDADADHTIDAELDFAVDEDRTPADQDDVDTLEIEGAAAADETPSSEEKEQEKEIGFDLSLQSSDLDELSIGGDTVGGIEPEAEADAESEIEFDLALQDTTEMNSLAIDDTLELPKASAADESLEDLTKSMEESMADLDLDDDDLRETSGGLDLSLADTSGTLDIDLGGTEGGEPETSLDFDLDDIDLDGLDQADTLAGELSEAAAAAPAAEDTAVVVPVEADDEQSVGDADEADTKLNLAKAYIELGDNDGARSILDEVTRDGSEDQQAEAQRLIKQIG